MPLYRVLAKIRPENIGVFPMASVPYWPYARFMERHWIHLLETHKTQGIIPPLNVHKEHLPFYSHPHHNRGSRPPSAPQTRTKKASKILHTTTYLLTYPTLFSKPPPGLNYLSHSKLHHLLSVLTGKPTFRYTNEETIQLTPAATITLRELHNEIHTFHLAHSIHLLTRYIHERLDTLSLADSTPSKPKFKAFNIMLLEHYHPYVRHLPIKSFFHNTQLHLPTTLSSRIKPIVVYTKSLPISYTLYNYKPTIKDLPFGLPS
jgi:hypothetical protein